MATYDYTGDGASVAPNPFEAKAELTVFSRRLKVSDIIASNATLTANAKITAGDIIQAIDIPDNFIFLGSAWYAITPEGAAGTADIGVAGGDEIQDGLSINEAAGDILLTLVTDDWGPDNVAGRAFEAGDTIDVNFVGDTDAGDWMLYVWGILLRDLT